MYVPEAAPVMRATPGKSDIVDFVPLGSIVGYCMVGGSEAAYKALGSRDINGDLQYGREMPTEGEL